MNSIYPYIIVILILITGCRKDIGLEKSIPLNAHSTIHEETSPFMGCGDTSAFKNIIDLQPLAYLKNCYSCTAIKEVPGLGEVSWTGNCEVYMADSLLEFRFSTYQPFFNELLFRACLKIFV